MMQKKTKSGIQTPVESSSASLLDDSRKLSNHLPFIFSRIVPAIAVGIFFWLGYIIFAFKQTSDTPIFTMDTWQDADAPFGREVIAETASGKKKIIQKFDPRFNLFNPWERAMIPDMLYTQMPLGSESGALTNATKLFNEPHQGSNRLHSGIDLNGIGGKDSDLADPVYAIASGLVVYSGNPSPEWGNCVILAHRTPAGKILHTLYAHLHTILVAHYDTLARGEQIGSVGKATADGVAHLHIELIESDGISPFLSKDTEFIHDRINPQQWITQYRQTPLIANHSPSVLHILRKNRILPDFIWKNTKDTLKFLRYTQPKETKKE